MSRYPTKPPMQPGQTNQREIEIETGVWVDYDEWQVAQNREKRYWEGRVVSEEDRAANLRKLDEILAEHFGSRRDAR